MLAWWTWENYVADTRAGEHYHFNSSKPRLHQVLNTGDSLWLVSGRPRPRAKGRDHVILQRLVVQAKLLNDPSYGYGLFRVIGNIDRSVYFAPDQPDMTDFLMGLPLAGGSSLSGTKSMAMAILSMRELSLEGRNLLQRWAQSAETVDPSAIF